MRHVAVIGAGTPPHAQSEPRTGAGRDIAASCAGTKIKLATNVHPRLISSSWPIDAVPGCPDNASEPNDVPVVSAENITARAVAEASSQCRPDRQFITEIDVERYAEPQKQWQRDDVGEIQRQRQQHHHQNIIAADSSRGASTSAASSKRRKASNRIIAIATTAEMAAERNAPMMVALVASIVTAVPPASEPRW